MRDAGMRDIHGRVPYQRAVSEDVDVLGRVVMAQRVFESLLQLCIGSQPNAGVRIGAEFLQQCPVDQALSSSVVVAC